MKCFTETSGAKCIVSTFASDRISVGSSWVFGNCGCGLLFVYKSESRAGGASRVRLLLHQLSFGLSKTAVALDYPL
jgi:hypothetical protein